MPEDITQGLDRVSANNEGVPFIGAAPSNLFEGAEKTILLSSIILLS